MIRITICDGLLVLLSYGIFKSDINALYATKQKKHYKLWLAVLY